MITCIEKGVNPYLDYEEYLKLGEGEDLQFVFSNTTEAGIFFDPEDKFKTAPHNSFPAKLTALLYRRFKHFNGNRDKGLTIIPCELINNNADSLKEIILKYAKLWELENEFITWIN